MQLVFNRMPFYTYRCNTCGLEKDFLKSMGDTKTQLCPKCCYDPNINGDGGFQTYGKAKTDNDKRLDDKEKN